jgi:hypothetical protein
MPRAPQLASLFGSILAYSAMFSASAQAEATAPAVFCAAHPNAPACSGASIGCDYCHTSTTPPEWNSYGLAVKAALGAGSFDANLAAALAAIASQDSDADGVSNGQELSEGTLPGNASSVLLDCDSAAVPPAARPYDFARAFRRVHVLYCGRSPSFDEVTAFEGLGSDSAARYAKIDAAVDACLHSDYWLGEGLQRLGDVRIRPNKAVGRNGTARLVIIGDYEWDYRLWTYVLSGDRDMRELLLATYHVERSADGALVKREGVIPEPEWAPTAVPNLVSDLIASGRGSPQGQPLEPEKRAGMITTSWFIAQNTMFSPLPRTTAAQALRAYLGQDIALGQGLLPVGGEPLDIDQRGVRTPGCSDCHSTLDPLAYAFTWYNGISGRNTGKYSTTRPAQIEGWTQNVGSLLGQPIRDAQDFAKVAVASDLFPRNLATMFLKHAVERTHTSAESGEFEELWRSIPTDGWSANKLIHRIVRSSFFGGGK